MKSLSDATLGHLRRVAEQPDFSSTRYTLGSEIGRGGMGVVYEAEDRELQRPVAIKVLALELTSAEAVDRLRSEARTIARLEHPGVVPVHDVGVLPDGRAWYAMKLVRGESLPSFMARPRATTELLRVFLRICEPVAYAHSHGVVHRDLKPDNIMIGSFGEVLVLDWGLATAIASDSERLVAGTRGFMAPEQEQGLAPTAGVDVFALGSILRIMLEGEAVRVPRPMRAIIARAVASHPPHRYADARELSDDVAAFADGLPVSAYRESLAEVSGRWLNRNRALVAMVAAYLLLRTLVFFFGRT